MQRKNTHRMANRLAMVTIAGTVGCGMHAIGSPAAAANGRQIHTRLVTRDVPPTGPLLGLAQVRRIAVREATSSRDPRPSSILVASGSLRAAWRVMSPDGELFPHPNQEEEAQLASTVYLVAMRGRFKPSYSHPRGAKPLGHITVIELLIDGHTGFREGRMLGSKTPVPLNRLGPVTRLR